MTLLEDIKKDLPNFSDEIIQNWLLPIADNYGWPPKNKEWESILLFKTVGFWQAKKWKKQNIDLNKITFSQDTIDISNGLYEAHMLGQDNLFSKIKNGQARVIRVLLYLIKNGKFPKPICLLCEQNQYSVLDGNHRFVAWRIALQLAEAIPNLEKKKGYDKIKKIQEKLGIESIAHILTEQEVWVAC